MLQIMLFGHASKMRDYCHIIWYFPSIMAIFLQHDFFLNKDIFHCVLNVLNFYTLNVYS